MDRIFQHYQGAIDELKGASFSCVKSACDNADGDVVLLWARDETLQCWYRIFIDGANCGVDRYEIGQSQDDFDEEVLCVDHSAWFQGKTMGSANVSCPTKPDEHIVLSMKFGEHECRLVCTSEDGGCHLQLCGSANA